MVRIGRPLIVLQVTAYARVRRQVVVVVDVTVGALARRNCVQSGERKVREAMVERCIRPRSDVVALLTGLRKAR